MVVNRSDRFRCLRRRKRVQIKVLVARLLFRGKKPAAALTNCLDSMKNEVPPPPSQFVKNKKREHTLGTGGRATINKSKGKLRVRRAWRTKSASFPMKLFYFHTFWLLKEAASSGNLYRQNSRIPITRRRRRRKKNPANKGENKGERNLVDIISSLPDHILLSIVSFLPLKDAVATSLLSRRWQYVWTSAVNLDFDAQFHVHTRQWSFTLMKPELKDLESRRYVDWVDSVLLQHRGPAVERFRACFYIDSRFTSSVDKWVQFAMNKRVQILELAFHLEDADHYPPDAYPFPHNLLDGKNNSTANLKPLHREIPCLRSCGYNIGFKFLRVLYFRYVDVSEEVLEYFLSNCPVLERLTVIAGQKNLVNFRVVGPSVALKYLDIQHCAALKSIEIRDAHLVSFTYVGLQIDLLLTNVPLLVEVSISERLYAPFSKEGEHYYRSTELYFAQLSCCLSQLKVLLLNVDRAMYNPDLVYPILSNLKHLELIVQPNDRFALCSLNSFMKASPSLQRLVLKVPKSAYAGTRKKHRVAKCPHPNLKVVEIVGYRARMDVVEHVMLLLESALALKRIVIDPVQRWEYPSRLYPKEMDRGAEEVEEEQQGRDHAMLHLKEKVPSTVEFVCL